MVTHLQPLELQIAMQLPVVLNAHESFVCHPGLVQNPLCSLQFVVNSTEIVALLGKILDFLDVPVNHAGCRMVVIIQSVMKLVTLLPRPTLNFLVIRVVHICTIPAESVVWETPESHAQVFETIMQHIRVMRIHNFGVVFYGLQKPLNAFQLVFQ